MNPIGFAAPVVKLCSICRNDQALFWTSLQVLVQDCTADFVPGEQYLPDCSRSGAGVVWKLLTSSCDSKALHVYWESREIPRVSILGEVTSRNCQRASALRFQGSRFWERWQAELSESVRLEIPTRLLDSDCPRPLIESSGFSIRKLAARPIQAAQNSRSKYPQFEKCLGLPLSGESHPSKIKTRLGSNPKYSDSN